MKLSVICEKFAKSLSEENTLVSTLYDLGISKPPESINVIMPDYSEITFSKVYTQFDEDGVEFWLYFDIKNTKLRIWNV